MVKYHHNAGRLSEDLKFELVEPLKQLFKDEVRACGVELGLPADMVYTVSHSLALVLVSVSSAKLPKRKLRSYKKQITFIAKKLPRQALTKVLDSTLQH